MEWRPISEVPLGGEIFLAEGGGNYQLCVLMPQTEKYAEERDWPRFWRKRSKKVRNAGHYWAYPLAIDNRPGNYASLVMRASTKWKPTRWIALGDVLAALPPTGEDG